MTTTKRREPNRTATRKASDPVMETYLRVRKTSLNLTTYPPTAAVNAYQRLIEEADEAIAAVVARLRYNGSSWDEIGEVLGVSRQAANKRYGGVTPR